MKNPTDQVLDEWLILQYQSGNEKALSILFQRWNKALIRQAYWQINDMEVAKDIAQEAWIAIMKGIYRLRDPSRFGAWAKSIAMRKSIDWLRKNKRVQVVQKDLERISTGRQRNIEGEGLEADKVKILRNALQLLKQGEQNILSLYYLEGYSVKSIGDILELPVGTVKSRLYHARQKLKNKLKQTHHENK